MATRKNVSSLTNAEVQAVQAAFVALKREVNPSDGRSTYDRYVLMHQQAMDHLTLWPADDVGRARRNAAHRGPGFLPWHRSYLWRLERDLQRVANDDTLGLPYWDWAADGIAVNQALAAGDPLPTLDVERVAGPAGTPTNVGGQTRYIVTSGPFGFDLTNPGDPNNWWTINTRGHEVFPLERRFVQNWDPTIEGPRPLLPVPDDVVGPTGALRQTTYDAPPWDQGSTGFRNLLEGWTGPGLHNVVHRWVGGSMLPGTSPNDPIFFLHHCNVDRIWAGWQEGRSATDYLPQGGGPCGHNAGDAMFPWNGIDALDEDTPAMMWDYRTGLNFEYDALPQLPPTP